ncbi:MAG: ECF transporter S component [Clostridia bacterium]|nr:ECF transporter S component [Clostridia bacterium]
MVKNTSQKVTRLTQYALLTALVVVLQMMSNVFVIGTVPISLSLIPLVLGAALYGPWVGTFLGFVLGLVNFVSTFSTPMLLVLFNSSPVIYIITCFGKTMAAGAVAGLLTRLVEKKNGKWGVWLAAISVPLINTGIFIVMMFLFFWKDLAVFSGSETAGDIVTYMFTILVGVNFLVEFLVNALLGPAFHRIVLFVRRLEQA